MSRHFCFCWNDVLHQGGAVHHAVSSAMSLFPIHGSDGQDAFVCPVYLVGVSRLLPVIPARERLALTKNVHGSS